MEYIHFKRQGWYYSPWKDKTNYVLFPQFPAHGTNPRAQE